jgi:hypothetical protein
MYQSAVLCITLYKIGNSLLAIFMLAVKVNAGKFISLAQFYSKRNVKD